MRARQWVVLGVVAIGIASALAAAYQHAVHDRISIVVAVPAGVALVALVLQLFNTDARVRDAEEAQWQVLRRYNAMLGPRDSALDSVERSPRERLAAELQEGAKIDELRATRALWLVPTVVIGGVVFSNLLDSHPGTSNIELAYALVKRLGTLAVTFYLAHAAVSQYRYSTLRAAHYRACSQALLVCEDDRTLIQVYRMLAPAQAFGAVPTSPVDALVKIAAGKDSDK